MIHGAGCFRMETVEAEEGEAKSLPGASGRWRPQALPPKVPISHGSGATEFVKP